MTTEKVVIVGSGPAGWTAAIYAARANLKPVIYAGYMFSEDNRINGTLPYGQLNLTTEVENYPGFPEGVRGPDLMFAMQAQAERFGTRTHFLDIKHINLNQRPFILTDNEDNQVAAEAVIITTGASANYLPLPSVETFRNRGVSACAVCDGALPRYRDKEVAVIGGGDSACEEAVYLAKYASKVYLIHRRDKLRASPIMAGRALKNPKIVPLWNKKVLEINGSEANGVASLTLCQADYNPNLQQACLVEQVNAVGVFFAIGHTPNTKFIKTTSEVGMHDAVFVNNEGFIMTGMDPEFDTATSVTGIFAAGDVADPRYKQAITAAGNGCKAALDAERFLTEHPLVNYDGNGLDERFKELADD